jgi:hypothetical protein
MAHDEDPLDLLEDDGDGVIETILLLEGEEEKKQIKTKTGCSVVFLVATLSGCGVAFGLFRMLV